MEEWDYEWEQHGEEEEWLSLHEKKAYTTLCLSGGGLKCIAMLGALEYLRLSGRLDQIRTIAGTSAGAVIGYMLCLGYTPVEINTYVNTHDLMIDFRNISIDSIIRDYAACKMINLKRAFKEVTLKKRNAVPTLLELFQESNIRLVVTVCNYTTADVEYFDYRNHPELSCVDLMEMSCSMTGIFPKVHYQGHDYYDGGIVENYPLIHIDNKRDLVIGINVLSDNTQENIQRQDEKERILDFIQNIARIPSTYSFNMAIRLASPMAHTINIKIGSVRTVEFEIPIEVSTELFCLGYRAAKTYAKFKNE